MAAAEYNITIEQGATFTRTLTLKDGNGAGIDLTGYQFRGYVKESQSATSTLAIFQFTLANQTTSPGVVTAVLPYSDTAALPVPESTKAALKNAVYLYDIEAQTPAGDVLRLLQGKATVVPEITK